MKILWFPKLQFDIDRLHITTWREMSREMNGLGHTLRLAVAGRNTNGDFGSVYIPIFIIPKKFFRIISFWICGFFQFIVHCFKMLPDAVIFDVFTVWFSLPLIFLPKPVRPILIIDNRTPVYLEEYHTRFNTFLMQSYTKFSFAYCKAFFDGITVITEHYRDYVCKTYGYQAARVGVWTSGVNTERFSPERFVSEPRPDFLKGKFVLMQHGEISHVRGIFKTLRALNMIDKPDICLMLVGDVMRGKAAREHIFKELADTDTGKHLHLLPPVSNSEIPRFISYCDCAIMAYPNIKYWNNNNPIKLVEYLSMAKPIICTDMWTFRKVMQDSPCAVYVKDNDPKRLMEAILFCYKNKELVRRYGAEGRKIALASYSWKRQAMNLVDFIGILKKKRKA
ncbi:MAG: glycosyltransferase [Candidatus Omnitrophota bacterium]